MAFDFKLQDPGEGIHEAEILEVLVAEGDAVKEGDNVLVVETDKAAVEIPSPVTGTIREIKVGEGDVVNVGDVLIVFDEEGAADGASKSDDGDKARGEEEETDEGGEEQKVDRDDEAESEDDEDEDEGDDEERKASADESADEKDDEVGSEEPEAEQEESEDAEGKAGREGDGRRKGRAGERKRSRRARDEQESDRKAAADGEGEAHEGGEVEAGKDGERAAKRGERGKGADRPVPATPAVRRLARELEVELAAVEGSGANGRVTEDDVRAAASEAKDEGDKKKRKSDQPEVSAWGETETVPLRSIRRAIARRMARSWREIPHVTHQDEIDITEIETIRRTHADDVERRGSQLTLTAFFIKALVAALKEHPRFNASLDTDREEIVIKHFYNIGVALDTERGLLVPVIHGADSKSVVEIAVELSELAAAIRGGRAKQGQLRGGTFSLTNVGALGGTQFSPIINHPEAAIFGTARAQLRPVVEGDLDRHSIEVRLILPVCVTFDHRINDGADAARFMDTVKAILSDPEALMLVG